MSQKDIDINEVEEHCAHGHSAPNRLTFGQWMRLQRESRRLADPDKWTVAYCAEQTGMSPKAWSRLEIDEPKGAHGSLPTPRMKTLVTVANCFGVPVAVAQVAAGLIPTDDMYASAYFQAVYGQALNPAADSEARTRLQDLIIALGKRAEEYERMSAQMRQVVDMLTECDRRNPLLLSMEHPTTIDPERTRI